MKKPRDSLSPVLRRFVTHWGEMGTRWGINRTVAQIHALLFVSEQPLNADDLVTILGVARSNISTSLKELVGWGIVRLVHVADDRRDHFTTIHDVWELFRIISSERKRREFDPTLKAIGDCLDEASDEPKAVVDRLKELQRFMTMISDTYEQVRSLPPGALAGLLGAAGLVRRLTPRRGGRP